MSWEATAEPIVTLRHGLAKSEEASRKKAQLVAQGRVDEAAQIRTWGSFGSPPLGSLIVALGKKIGKTYQTDGRPLYLLLYYEHQGAIEPFDRLLSVEAGHNYVKQFLTDSPFSTVWLYRHMPAHCLVTAPIANRPIPLKDFEGPETNRRVIGVLRLVDGSPHFTVDVSFEHSYHAAVAALSAHFRPRSSRTGIDSSAI